MTARNSEDLKININKTFCENLIKNLDTETAIELALEEFVNQIQAAQNFGEWVNNEKDLKMHDIWYSIEYPKREILASELKQNRTLQNYINNLYDKKLCYARGKFNNYTENRVIDAKDGKEYVEVKQNEKYITGSSFHRLLNHPDDYTFVWKDSTPCIAEDDSKEQTLSEQSKKRFKRKMYQQSYELIRQQSKRPRFYSHSGWSDSFSEY